MVFRDAGMLKMTLQTHSNFLHDSLRRQIHYGSKAIHLIKTEVVETILKTGAGSLCRVSLVPGNLVEPPTDFYTRTKLHIKFSSMKPYVSHKQAGSFFFHCVKAIPVIRKFLLDGCKKMTSLFLTIRLRKIVHHLRVSVHFGERLQIGFSPAP